MRVIDLRQDTEEAREYLREKEANEMVEQMRMMCFTHTVENKVGAAIKKWGHRFPRLNELRSRHFQNQAADYYEKQKGSVPKANAQRN